MRNDVEPSPEPLLREFGPTSSTWRRSATMARLLLIDGGLIRDPVLIYSIVASFSRFALIFSINNAGLKQGPNTPALLLLAGSATATLFFSHMARIRNHQVVERLQSGMRKALSHRLLGAGAEFLLGRDHGKIYTVMTQETKEVAGSAQSVLQAIEAAFLLLVCIPYLFWISWPIGLATLAAVSLGGFGLVLTEVPAQRLVKKCNNASAAFCDRVSDMLGGWMELRLRQSRRHDLERDAINTAEAIRDFSVGAERYFNIGNTVTQTCLFALLCGIVVVLPLIDGGGSAILFQVLTVILLSYGPIETILGGLPQISRAVASQQKIAEVVRDLNATMEIDICPQTQRKATFGRIEFRDVAATLSDAGGRAITAEAFEVGPIDLVLQPGEVVFICGGNGAGKSTLLSLITGLRQPDAGTILMDGVPVTNANRAEYRHHFSAVFSQFHLFRKPYGLAEEEKQHVNHHIRELGLEDRVTLEDEFSTLSLSSGQKRRLALAVALSEASPIIVMDEFAADQDPARRAFFYDVLVPRLAALGHLVLAVTHDEQSFSKCDRLIKMDCGRIVADLKVARTVSGIHAKDGDQGNHASVRRGSSDSALQN